MPKFQENKGFKMPGIGSKEKHTPGSFREEHHVDKMGYCDDTPLNMLPPGSSPVTFMGNEPLASSSDGSPLSYKYSLDDDPYTSVKYTPGSLDFSDAFGDDDKAPVKSESNPDGKQGNNTNITNYFNSQPQKGGIESTLVKEQNTNTTAGKTTYTPPKRTKEGDEAYANLTPAQRKAQDEKYIRLNTKTTPGSTSTVYKVNGKVVDKATYDASGSVNKSKEKK